MIPIKMSVRNFLSYFDSAPELDLEGVHVACLCGDNGHGKSALLDAITWALWGIARTRTQAELVYQGQSEMKVDLEFEAGDGRYKVSRRYRRSSRGTQGTTFLELFHYSTSHGFQAVTGNTVRETELKICSLLRMDYHTFVNSAFILQGRADMFTTSTPSKRKELLGEVLGLSWYERLAERSRGLGRERDSTLRMLNTDISSMDKELSHREEYEGHRNDLQGVLIRVEDDIKERESTLEDLHIEAQRLQSLKLALEGLELEEKRVREEVTRRDTRILQQTERLKEIKTGAEKLDSLEVNLGQLRMSLKEMTTASTETGIYRMQAQELQSRVLHLEEVNVSLKADMIDLRRKVDLLDDDGAQPVTATSCPLCGQSLGTEECLHLSSTYQAQGQQKADDHRENEASIREMKLEIIRLEKVIVEWEAESVAARQREEDRHNLLIGEVEKARAMGNLVDAETSALKTEELSALDVRHRLQDIQVAIPSLKLEVMSLSGILDTRNEARAQVEFLRERQHGLIESLGAVQGQLERCRELELIRRNRLTEADLMSHQKGIYDQLSLAFGKGGIQALLIEQALPELEDQANEILGRVTDHRMSLKLETQIEKPGGGDPRETLDIKISDELGTRSYETYSGGETFRINFALRIAISKLLAHRSGAPLPTLFIDEGFGTQDASGLERLVEVINTIQDDFQKIIVITHIDEMKEAFPVRIEVTKTSRGSTFSVI